MPLFQNAVFHTTVANLRDLPQDAISEVAFAGRSNAGKSSAINTLAGRVRLAFVSKTPGRTQHLNYFTLAAGKYFVDLPGYGYAKAPEEIRTQWEGLIGPYLSRRGPLVGLVVIMDCRRPFTALQPDPVVHPRRQVAGQVQWCFHCHIVNLGVEDFFEIIRVHRAQFIQAKGRFYGWSG